MTHKIWHFSDTHTHHKDLKVPNEEGLISIFSGDCSNPKDFLQNTLEVLSFLDWYAIQNIDSKIFVAGNHDVSIEKNRITKQDFKDRGIIYLENDSVEINDLKIWGSPLTPSFGSGWAWNKARHKLDKYWAHIPDDTDILVTHGPPKGFLDYTCNNNKRIEQCGCESLKNRVLSLNLSAHCFGHIHNRDSIHNAGMFLGKNFDGKSIIFSNGTVTEDRTQKGLTGNGNYFKINKE